MAIVARKRQYTLMSTVVESAIMSFPSLSFGCLDGNLFGKFLALVLSNPRQVLVEYVPTSFGYVFHVGMHFSNTHPVECRRPAAVFYTQHTFAGTCSTLSHWVWGFTAGQCLELCFSGVI